MSIYYCKFCTYLKILCIVSIHYYNYYNIIRLFHSRLLIQPNQGNYEVNTYDGIGTRSSCSTRHRKDGTEAQIVIPYEHAQLFTNWVPKTDFHSCFAFIKRFCNFCDCKPITYMGLFSNFSLAKVSRGFHTLRTTPSRISQ